MDGNDKETFIQSGFLYFLISVIISIFSWGFWLIVTKFTTSLEIGFATTVLSLVAVFTGLTLLGFDYTLLKESVIGKAKTFGNLTLISLLLNIVALPIFILVGLQFYEGTIDFSLLLLGYLSLFFTVQYVSRGILIGTLKMKKVLISDVIGIVLRLIAVIIFLQYGWGASGIIFAILLHSVILSIITNILAYRQVGFAIGDFTYVRHLLRSGISNFPPKLSRLLITHLGVLLFAVLINEPDVVGVFYIAIMISLVGSVLGVTLSQISISVSSVTKSRLSGYSTKIGLLLTCPIIAIIISSPELILSWLGSSYIIAATPLAILGISILPSIIYANIVAKLNSENKFKKLAKLGMAEVLIFIPMFFVLTVQFEMIGAALSILITFCIACGIGYRFIEKENFIHIAFSILAIFVGWLSGIIIGVIIENSWLTLSVSFISTIFTIFVTKAIKPHEISELIHALGKK